MVLGRPFTIYLRLGVEFDPEPGYAYEICYSTNDVLSPASLSVVNGGGNIYVENATRMIFALFNEFTPQELDRGSLYLVRYSLAPGGCVLNLPGIGAVTASKTNGTVTLANGTKITAGPVGATIRFPNGAEITIGTNGVLNGTPPTGVSHVPGVANVSLPGGISVNPGTGDVTITGPAGLAGASVTVGGPGGLRVALPPGLASIAGIIGKAVDTVGNILGIGTDPNKTKVDNGDGTWRDLDDPVLGAVSGTGTQTVRVGATDADNRAPKPANIFTITFSFRPQIKKKITNGDISTLAWSNATEQPLDQPIYAGDTNGDMVSWSLDDLLPGDYAWTATGPYFSNSITIPSTIQGPSGENMREWRIARNFSNSGELLLNWKPGTYRIKCRVTRSMGESYDVEYQQRVGWRTARYLVVGQVRPIADFAISASQQAALKTDLLSDLNTNRLPLLALVNPAAAAAAATIATYVNASSTSLEEIAKVWFVLRSAPPASLVSFPNIAIGGDERFWLTQVMLNENPDAVNLAGLDSLSGPPLIALFAQQSYRMLGEYELKYLLGEDRKILGSSIATVGSPSSLSGPTKLAMGALAPFGDSILGWLGLASFTDGGGNLLVPSMDNSHNGQQRDLVGGRLSLYTSGRIGVEASRGNYSLFGRDVPYIFNEIIFGLGADGRDAQNKIRLSIDKTWNADGPASGSIYFNEIRIYKRINGFASYDFQEAYRLDNQAGMLRPFINSVPLGQFPTVESVPAVLNTIP